MTKFKEEISKPLCVLDENGHEVLDQSPVAIPVRFQRVESMTQEIARLVNSHLSILAYDQGYETFDEADDFDVGDEEELRSNYEIDDEDVFYVHRNDATAGGTPTNPGSTEPNPNAIQQPGQNPPQSGGTISPGGTANAGNPGGPGGTTP